MVEQRHVSEGSREGVTTGLNPWRPNSRASDMPESNGRSQRTTPRLPSVLRPDGNTVGYARTEAYERVKT
jgi:hypothetical protein